MKVVGLCGGSGSGKSALSGILAMHGIPVINADEVYAELVSGDSACLRELVAAFGKKILSPKGSLDREAMSSIVFSGDGAAKRRALLNSITHRYVLEEMRSRLSAFSASGVSIVAVDVPLLFESGFDKECDLTVAVIADRKLRIDRICARDHLEREAAERRIDSQLSTDELMARADYIVRNEGDIDALELEAKKLIDFVTKQI